MANENVTIELDLVLDDGTAKKAFGTITNEGKKAGAKTGKEFKSGFSDNIQGIFKDLKSTVAGGFGLSIGATVGGAIVSGIQAFGTAIRESIENSVRQEEAVLKLENSLRRIGEFSNEASEELQNYASALQKVTRVGDEAILEQLSFAQGLGATVEQSKQVVDAALNLSSALSIDLNSAVRNITKTLSGQKGELGELVPALRSLTAEQLRNGEGINVISKLYAGFAQRDAKGFGAEISRLKGAFADFSESIGSLVTNSKLAQSAISGLTTTFAFYADLIKRKPENASIDDTKKKVEALRIEYERLASLADETAKKNIDPLSKFFNIAGRAKEDADEAKIAYFDAQQELLALEEEAVKQKEIREAKEKAKVEQSRADALESLRSLGLTQLLDEETIFTQRITALTNFLEQRRITEEQYENLRKQAEEQYTQFLKKQEGDRVKNSFDANRALGSIVANQTQTLVKSLLAGEKAGDSFKNFILGSFGELATQMGSFFIATGIAQLKLFSLDPTGTIAAGVGLVALGQILSSFQSKGLAGGASTSTASGTTPFSNDNVTSQIQAEPIEPETKVVVNIQGNILDSQESGSYIIDAINKAVDGTGATLRRNAIA